MTKNEALQMCLEYIETDAHERRHVRWAIKEALVQPEQEFNPDYDTQAVLVEEMQRMAKRIEELEAFLAGKQTSQPAVINMENFVGSGKPVVLPLQRTEQKPVAHCEAGPEYCPVCQAETQGEE